MNTLGRAVATTAVLLISASQALAFGAIAVDDKQGFSADDVGYGLGWGTTRREAERNAMSECRSAGNTNCTVAVWFESCGAYAGSRVHYKIGYGRTLEAAEEMALADCPKCRIVISECE